MGPERLLESKIARWCHHWGYQFLKLAGPPGWPDRTVITPGGAVAFVEFKAGSQGRLSRTQKYWQGVLIKQRCHHYVAREYVTTIKYLQSLDDTA